MSKYQEAYNQIIGSLNLYRYELFFEKRNEPDSFIKEKKLLQELVNKAKPKKPIFPGENYFFLWKCPSCNQDFISDSANNYCLNCGQAIDWSEDE